MSSPLCFVLLCGIPGAGKSTVARGLQAAAEADGDEGMGMRTTVVRIEVDTYMGEGSNTPEFSSEAWKRARRLALDDARRAMQGETGRVLVILDDTMHLRSMRRECWQLARAVSSAYVQICVVCSLKQALNRNAQRPLASQIPEHVIAKAATSFEDPQNSSCEWDRNTLVIENESFKADMSSLWYQVLKFWREPAPKLFDHEAERRRVDIARGATANDSIHQLDLRMRRMLAQTLTLASTSSIKASIAAQLNVKRRSLLELAREQIDSGTDDSDKIVAYIESIFNDECRSLKKS